jgi:hypothetical protein
MHETQASCCAMAMDALDSLRPITLEALEERAALLRRVDTKYLVAQADLTVLIEELARDHDVLEIDGQRRFSYRSVYFDTPDMRAFHDHVNGVRPRFKLRTRCYLDADTCQFEVKLKREDDETSKRQMPYPPAQAEQLTPEAIEFVAENLAEAGIAPAGELRPQLSTEFDRVTLVARDGSSRITSDTSLRLRRLPGGAPERQEGPGRRQAEADAQAPPRVDAHRTRQGGRRGPPGRLTDAQGARGQGSRARHRRALEDGQG